MVRRKEKCLVPVKNWRQFDAKLRFKKPKLLNTLDQFTSPVLVAGCQRSGTTALTKIIANGAGMSSFDCKDTDVKDVELIGAQILAGALGQQAEGRYCFQTTYLNDSFTEYFEHKNYKLVWVLRTPASVVYSMLYNWGTGGINRLFKHCGADLLDDNERRRYDKWGSIAIPKLRRACLGYNAKIMQTKELSDKLDRDRLLVIDYGDLVLNKEKLMPNIFEFCGLEYKKEYAERIHSKSVDKAKRFSEKATATIEADCMPVYREAREYIS
jgi:hypothetical protein